MSDSEIHVINAEHGKYFSVGELRAIFSRPGILNYSVVTTGISTSRIKRVTLTVSTSPRIYKGVNEENPSWAIGQFVPKENDG